VLLADPVELLAGHPELAQPDELPELGGPDADPLLRARQDLVLDPVRVRAERGVGLPGRFLESCVIRTGEDPFPRRHDRLEETRKSLGRLQADLRPELNGVSDPGLRLFDVPGRPLQSVRDALETLRKRRELAHEEREESVTDPVGSLRHRLPYPYSLC